MALNDKLTPAGRDVGAGNILNIDSDTACNAVIIYHKGENKSEDYFQRLNNAVDYDRDVATGKKPGTDVNPIADRDSTVSCEQMIKEFDFVHSADLDYDTNIENSLEYMFDYDKNLFDPVFEDIRPISIVTLNIPYLLDNNIVNLDTKTSYSKYIIISRDIYSKQDSRSNTECMILVNGELPAWYKDIIKTNTSFAIPADNIKKTDRVEVIYFRNIRNELLPLNKENKDEDDYLYLPSTYIPKEDLIVYTNVKSDYCLTPVIFEFDELTSSINLYDNKYRDTGLYIGSKLQFRYARVPIYKDTNMVMIPSTTFRSCYNPDKYMIFVDGKLLNKSTYKMVIPSLTNNKIEVKALYTTNILTKDSRVDIFYYGGDFMSRVEYYNSSNEVMYKTIKLYATKDDQKIFEITTPYKDYTIENLKDSGILVFRDSLYISDALYYITESNDKYYLNFTEDLPAKGFVIGDCITIIIPCYKDNYNYEDPITDNNRLLMVTRESTATSSKQYGFTYAPDFTGDLIDISYIFAFNNTELIDNNDLYMQKRNELKSVKGYSKGTTIAAVVLTDKYDLSTNSVVLSYQYIYPKQGTKVFTLKHSYLPQDSYMVFRNHKLVDPKYYVITRGSPDDIDSHLDKLIWNYPINDLYHEDVITVVSAADSSSVKYATKFFYTYASYTNENSATITNYANITYSKTNMMVFVNGEFISNTRLTINKNVITFNDITLKKTDTVIVYTAYKAMNIAKYGRGIASDIENEVHIKFTKVTVKATSDKQTTYSVPQVPELGFSKKFKFILFTRGQFISSQYYYLNSAGDTLTLENADNIKKGDRIDFVFCAHKDISIDKIEYCIPLRSRSVSIPTSFDESLDLNTHMMIFYGSTYIDSSRYTLNNNDRIITFDDIPASTETDRILTIVVFYDTMTSVGSVEELDSSGYIRIGENTIDRNFNKNMYMLFVNGKKVAQDSILDVTNDIKKITTDIRSTYGVEMFKFSPLVVELENLYKSVETHETHEYTVTIPEVENQMVYVECNGFIHHRTFNVEEGATFTAYSVGGFSSNVNKCWVPGAVTPASGTVNSDVEISVEPATEVNRISFCIKATKHQTIYVEVNDRIYQSREEEDYWPNELPDATFKAYIRNVEEGYSASRLNYSSGTLKNGFIIQAISEPVRDTVEFQVLNQNLEDQTFTLHIYNEDGYNVVLQGPGTYMIPYGYYIYFDLVGKSGYGGGESLGGGLFKQERPYRITNNYYGLIPDPATIDVTSVTVIQSANQTVSVSLLNDENNIVPFTSSFAAQVGQEYEVNIVADEGYESGEVLKNSNTDTVSNGLVITATDAVKKEESSDEQN